MAILHRVTATALNLRAAPAPTAPVLNVLRRGQVCSATGAASDGWLPVTFERFAGYVSDRFVQPSQEVAPPSPAAPSVVDPEVKLRDRTSLHPQFRNALDALLTRTAAEGLPFRVFEAFRTPERQEWLYAQGRSRPGGKVTNARAWQSFHQYGLAADLVLFIDGRWSWSNAGPLRHHWTRMREIAADVGLRTLDWEAPHVEWPVSLSEVTSTSFVAAGDEDWLDALQLCAQRWKRSGRGGEPDIGWAERQPLREAVS